MLIYRRDLEFASISNWRVKKRKHGNFNLQTPEVCPRTGANIRPTFNGPEEVIKSARSTQSGMDP